MRLIDVIAKWAGSAQSLIDLLQKIRDEVPDLAPLAVEWLEKLATAASQENLVALATELPKEIANVVSGKIDPRSHPSDLG